MPFPPLPPGLQEQADEALEEFSANLDVYQAEYMLTHDVPWQGLLNPPDIPANGNNKSLDLFLRPADQEEDWHGVVPDVPRVVSLQTDVHNGELGTGRTDSARIKVGSGTWLRQIGKGFYATTADWYEIVDATV